MSDIQNEKKHVADFVFNTDVNEVWAGKFNNEMLLYMRHQTRLNIMLDAANSHELKSVNSLIMKEQGDKGASHAFSALNDPRCAGKYIRAYAPLSEAEFNTRYQSTCREQPYLNGVKLNQGCLTPTIKETLASSYLYSKIMGGNEGVALFTEALNTIKDKINSLANDNRISAAISGATLGVSMSLGSVHVPQITDVDARQPMVNTKAGKRFTTDLANRLGMKTLGPSIDSKKGLVARQGEAIKAVLQRIPKAFKIGAGVMGVVAGAYLLNSSPVNVPVGMPTAQFTESQQTVASPVMIQVVADKQSQQADPQKVMAFRIPEDATLDEICNEAARKYYGGPCNTRAKKMLLSAMEKLNEMPVEELIIEKQITVPINLNLSAPNVNNTREMVVDGVDGGAKQSKGVGM